MKRRSIMKKLGTATLTTTALAGTASAQSGRTLELDEELDVSEVSGTVELADLLPEEKRLELNDGTGKFQLDIDESTESIEPQDLPCCDKCGPCEYCECHCCYCDFC